MKYYFTFFLIITVSLALYSQNDYPKDYLSKEFHKERRDALRKKMPSNSVAIFFANPIRNRANDVDYVYHQDPNFYYLTGYKEPHVALVVFSEAQTGLIDGISCNEILFVQEKNKRAEMWTGVRLGVKGAREKLGFNCVLNSSAFKGFIDFSKYETVFFNEFEDDYRDNKRNTADLFDLTNALKQQTGYLSDDISLVRQEVYEAIKATSLENSANVAKVIGEKVMKNPELKQDGNITSYVSAQTNALRKEIKENIIKFEALPAKRNYDTKKLASFMAELREIKTPEEMVLLKKAVRISAQGQIEVMKAMTSEMSETEVQGIHEYVYKKYGSEYEGYPSIVGAGNNGCVLHYVENSKMNIKNELVLMDLGAEYHGYSADVTRTIPANGKFSKEQRLIYDVVYDAQEAGIAACTVDAKFWGSHLAAQKVINEGLAKLGIIEAGAKHTYFPHGTSHYIGLDVHDPGTYGPLRENSVITVEPGIYIPEGSNCDKKWWGIAVRIEDDILITANGPVNLSIAAPRKADEIEKMMKQKSALDDFKLPKLD